MRKVLALLLSLLMFTPALAEETVIPPLPMGLTDTGYTPDPNAFIAADEENGGYSVDVPVIVGLNDANYEKSLNDSLMQQRQDYIAAFIAEENTADSLLQVQVTTGFCTKDFLSILWEGTRDGMPVRFAKNFDLLGQKAVTLADIPVFGIVDTNSDPSNVDFVIPANDDATKSIEVILDACCAAMIEGLEERKAEKIDMEAAGEAPANKGKKKSVKARLDKSDEEAINAAKAAAFIKEDEEA